MMMENVLNALRVTFYKMENVNKLVKELVIFKVSKVLAINALLLVNFTKIIVLNAILRKWSVTFAKKVTFSWRVSV